MVWARLVSSPARVARVPLQVQMKLKIDATPGPAQATEVWG